MKNVKISGFYDEFSGDFETQLKKVKELGESYMCPRKLSGKNIADFTAEEFKNDAKPLMDKYGVKFSSIGSPIGKIELNDEEAYQTQLKKLTELVKICQMVNCKYIRIFSFHVDASGDFDSYFPIVVKKLKGFLEVVKGTDVVLLHENEKKIFGDLPERCLKLYKEINDPQFQLAYDASNFIQCDADPIAAYELLKDYVVYYHIKDCSPEKVEVPVGLGIGNYKAMLTDLINVRGYEGFLTLEPHTGKYADLKVLFNILFPITALIPPVKNFHKVFRRIDNAKGIKAFQKVEHTTPFMWQYNGLKEILSEIAK
jgi:sugar phosphate isomerase/epimerase